MNSDDLEILNNKIIQEMSGVWFIYNDTLDKVEMHIKIPEVRTKGIIDGCKVLFHLAVSKLQPRSVVLAVTIYDTDTPGMHIMIPEIQIEIDGINMLFEKQIFNVIIYGDKDTPCATGSGTINSSSELNKFKIEDYNFKAINHIHEKLYEFISLLALNKLKDYEIHFDYFRFELIMNVKSISVLYETQSGKLLQSDIGDISINEGDDLENTINYIAESYNHQITYHSPQFLRDETQSEIKEFCDVLINEPQMPIIIQSKAVAYHKSGERKKKEIKKREDQFIRDTKNAISQLNGSIRKYKDNKSIIFEKENKRPIQKYQVPPIGIAIVTEAFLTKENENFMEQIQHYGNDNVYIIVMSIDFFSQLIKFAKIRNEPLWIIILNQYHATIRHNILIPNLNID